MSNYLFRNQLYMIVERVANLEVATVNRDLEFKWYILASLESTFLVIIGRFFNSTIAAIIIALLNLVLYVPHY